MFKEQKKGIFKAFEVAKKRVEAGQSLEDVAAEGFSVMKKMGVAAGTTFGEMKSKMDAVTKAPPKKKGYTPKPEKDLFRIGSVSIFDLRVFTRNMLAKDRGEEQGEGEANKVNAAGWHKPILFKQVVVGAAELSSPPGIVNAKGTAPRVGMHVKEISRVMQKRMIAETGKTNSAVLLQTAFGEVSDFLSNEKGLIF